MKVIDTNILLHNPNILEEINEAASAFKLLSCHVEDEQIEKKGEDIIRYNLFIKKDKETQAKYPRSYSKIKKKPL